MHMKNFHHILVLAAALLVSAAACQKAPYVTFYSPSSFNFTSGGGSHTFEFATNRDWSVSASESWCHVSPSSGTASDQTARFTISCDANTTYDPRSCTLTVKAEELTETVSITQETNQGLLASPTSFEVGSAGKQIEVEVRANVNYTVAVDPSCSSWIKHTGTKGLTSKTIVLDIAANETYSAREGWVVVKQADGILSQTITVKQAQNDGLFVSTPEYNLSNAGHTLTVEVRSNVEYEVSSQADWIHYIPSTKALTSSQITLEVDANQRYDAREGQVTVRQKGGGLEGSILIRQEENYGLFVSGGPFELSQEAQNVEVEVKYNVDFDVIVPEDAREVMITSISFQDQGANTKALSTRKYSIGVAQNTTYGPRETTITFKQKDGALSGTVKIAQAQNEGIVVNPAEFKLGNSMYSLSVQVQANVEYEVSTSAQWIHYETPTKALNTSQLTLRVDANDTYETREGVVSLKQINGTQSATVKIVQDQRDMYSVSPTEITLPFAGGSSSIVAETNIPLTVTVTGNPDWLSVSKDQTKGMETQTYTVTAQENKGDQREADIVFNGKGWEQTVHVIQSSEARKDGDVTVLQQHTLGSGVPIVILGDGFTREDIDKGVYAKAAQTACNYFFSAEPVTSLREYFDVWSICYASTTRSFNGDTHFKSQFLGGTTIDGDTELAVRYASKVVPYSKKNDMVVIIVLNSTRYAGTCYMHFMQNSSGYKLTYSVAFVPMVKQAGATFEDVLHHEACGHGLGKLADEYNGSGTISASESKELVEMQKAGAYVNVDIHEDVTATLWADFAADARFSYEQLGTYEGAYTFNKGVYRPTRNSMMHDDYRMFNAPSRAQIYRRVMGIANNWKWTYDYETFVNFDAPFRSRNYGTKATTSRSNFVEREEYLEPLAPPVWVRDN